jgi:hypothetical protein
MIKYWIKVDRIYFGGTLDTYIRLAVGSVNEELAVAVKALHKDRKYKLSEIRDLKNKLIQAIEEGTSKKEDWG